jgi:type II secretion system protein G
MRGHKLNSKDGAFTLIEILIVVIILGVLSAIVVPLFSESADEAELETCMANLGIIYRSMQIYELRNGQYPTSTDDLAVTFPTLPTCPLAGEYTWDLAADRYHVVCRGQHGPDVDHACIRDTHGPNAR